LLTSCFLILMFVLPVAVFSRNFLIIVTMALIAITICVALTWLPYWIMLIVALLIAGLYSAKVKGWLG
jgi:hypothetical protein